MRVIVAWFCLAATAAIAPVAHAEAPAADHSASVCDTRGTAAVAAMLSKFTDAIASRHPDKVARLFAPDATFTAFHADGVRASYDQIRDAFVYFLVTSPDVTFATMSPSSGCGIVAIEGTGIWRRPAAKTEVEVETPVRISMVLVETPDGWRIQQYADERLEADARTDIELAGSVPQRRTPAVAGYVARSRGTATKPAPAPKIADPDAYKAGRWIADAPSFD